MADSPEVMVLRARLEECRPGATYGPSSRAYWHKAIRRQRLLEAQTRGTHTEEQWLAVLERFDYRCVRCGCWPEGRPCKDHITPLYQGGSDGIDNLQPMCRECNTAKGPDAFNWAAYRDELGFGDCHGW